MKKDPIDPYLKPLEELQPVETPPFLLSRIRAAITRNEKEWVSPGKVALAGFAFSVLLLFNTIVLLHKNRQVKKDTGITQSFDLLPDNDFYK